MQYAGQKISSKFWPSLETVESALASDTMGYNMLKLGSLIAKGLPGHSATINATEVNPKDLFLDDVTFNLIEAMYDV